MTTIQCPVCQGRKTTLVHYNYSNRPHEWREDPCRTCNGTGAITEEQAANRDAGRKIYEARVALNLSLKDFSVLSKVDYARQSKIENDITEGSAAEIILIKRE